MKNTFKVDPWLLAYQIYLNSQKWKDKRKKVLEYWDHKCATCYSPINLHVHHRTYARVGKEKLTDLIVLCSKCHEKFHGTLGKQAGPNHPLSVSDVIYLSQALKGIEK